MNVTVAGLVCAMLLSALVAMETRAASCDGTGPQAPRDIGRLEGRNTTVFGLAAPSGELSLCNVHFHKYAEHRGPSFSRSAGTGEHAGFVCEGGGPETAAMEGSGHDEHPAGHGCGNVAAGDTIEVHWVFTSCDVAPGPGLGSCLSEACANPQLRVEAGVFALTEGSGRDFRDFGLAPRDGARYQPKALPAADDATLYRGSTTGPSYSDTACSPYQVTWNVRHGCESLDLASLNEWCGENVFEEDHAHGVRPLVTDPGQLAPIQR